MKFSPFIPKYSDFIKLLKVLDEFPYGKVYNFLKLTEKIERQSYEDFISYEYIKEKYNLNDKVINEIEYFYSETGTIPTAKDILFAEHHNLLYKIDGNKIGKDNPFSYYLLTGLGKKFVEEDLVTLAEIDNKEMLLFILEDMSKYQESDDLSMMSAMDSFFPLLNSNPDYEFIESRVNNLVCRKLLNKYYNKSEEYYIYKISKKGLKYLNYFKHMQSGKSYIEKYFLVTNDIEKLKMIEWLYSINPYELENLIGILIKKMGYVNVKITSKGNDNGIDLIAEINAGTSIIKEIFQVKRWKSNIHRPTLDQIRGVLSVSKAIRATIITTSDFSQGCYDSLKDNDSITLINGKKLMSLLLKHELGLSKNNVSFYTFSPLSLKLK